MPINIVVANAQILQQNEELQAKIETMDDSAAIRELLMAIYQRQGDAIILNLTTGGR